MTKQTVGDELAAATPEIETLIGILGAVAGTFLPGASLAGLAIPEIVSLVKGAIAGVPQVVQAVKDIQAAIDGGAAPTAVQLAALKAAVDAADDQLQADIDAANKSS